MEISKKWLKNAYLDAKIGVDTAEIEPRMASDVSGGRRGRARPASARSRGDGRGPVHEEERGFGPVPVLDADVSRLLTRMRNR